MKNTMEYKGYIGSVEFSEEDELFYGSVQGIRSLISYDGRTGKELIDNFHGAVEDYLLICSETGTAPEQAYKGSFNIRIEQSLHRSAAVYAINNQQSLNHFVEEAIRDMLKTLGAI